MRALKKISFLLFIGVAAVLAAWAYFYLRNNKKPATDALSALPDSCLVYLNTGDLGELNRKVNSRSLLLDKLKALAEINTFCQVLERLDSLVAASEMIRAELAGNTVHFALYGSPVHWLATFNITQLGDEPLVRQRLSQLPGYAEVDGIGRFKLPGQVFYFSVSDGIVLLSDSKQAIVTAANGARLRDDPGFSRFSETLEATDDLSLYVDHRLYAASPATKLNFGLVSRTGHSAGNISLQPAQVKVNGFFSPGDADPMAALANEPPQPTPDLYDLLPQNTVWFKAYGYGSYTRVRARLGDSDSYREPADTRQFWSKVAEVALYDVRKEFDGNATTPLVQFSTGGDDYIALRVNDTAMAREHLRWAGDTIFQGLYRLRQPVKLFAPLLATTCRYAALIGSCLVFSDLAPTLNQLLHQHRSDESLKSNESFMAYAGQNLDDEFNFMFYTSPALAETGIDSLFHFKKTSPPDYSGTKHFSYSLTNDAHHYRFRCHTITHAGTGARQAQALWSVMLDTTVSQMPYNFVNHSTGENELVVQDDANTLYLINAKGAILWRKRLEATVLSPIYRVDAFKNNKYQLLFNTGTHLHLVDRLGRNVEGYPVKLPARATAPLAVFDYEGNREYRLLVACDDRRIYNYAISGRQQEGFATVKTAHQVNMQVQYAHVGPNDFLVAVDREGHIYVMSRKGEPRLSLTNRTVAGCKAVYIDAAASLKDTWMVYLDEKNGLISKVSFTDKKEIVKLSEESEGAWVSFETIDANRQMDLLVSAGHRIMAYNFQGENLFSRTTTLAPRQAAYFGNDAHSFYYAYDPDEKELLLFDAQRQKERTFKATGMPHTLDLFNDQKRYLVIPNGNRLNCVLVN